MGQGRSLLSDNVAYRLLLLLPNWWAVKDHSTSFSSRSDAPSFSL